MSNIGKFRLVCQAKLDLMVLWVHPGRGTWKAHGVKEGIIGTATRRLFPPKRDRIERIGLTYTLDPSSTFEISWDLPQRQGIHT